MKFYTTYVTAIFVCISTFVFAQETQVAAFLIPQELKEDANAVIRNESTIVTISAVDEMTVKVSKTITILNKLGNDYIGASVGYDDDTKILSVNAEIYDAFGTRIKKFRKKDFLDFSAVSGGTLYSDNRVKELQYTPTKYPYTVKFNYEYRTSSTGFIPSWYPIHGYYLGVEKSVYRIMNPSKVELRQKENNFEGFAIENRSTIGLISYEMKNQKPVEYERSTKYRFNIFPFLKVAPNDFTLKGVQGKASNWKEFGQWVNAKLLKGADQLDPATISKVKGMVSHTDDPIEKAKIVYEYMQNKTRYISVQIGIGGWKPIAANQVDKVGYGDCKGLTNYTKALLDVVGVKSYYTIVYASRKRNIDKDFTSLQGNHAILNIPNDGEDIWLECTSQTKPFGFLGDFTDDRDVLVITPEGGVIKHTPAYLNEANLQHMKAEIQLDVMGNAKGTVNIVSKGIKYDTKYRIESFSKKDKEKYYKTNFWDYNNNLNIASIDIKNNKDSIVFLEKVTVAIENYASVQQGAYLFRVNMFNKNGYVPKRYRKRNNPLKVSRGYKDIDEFTIKLPEGYQLEAKPTDIVLEKKFGVYKVNFTKVDDSTIIYKRELFIKAGTYPKEDYKPYRSFRKKIAKYDGLRLSLIKKT
ncbi:DUF3857 domain-containing protein [Flavobacteriaceae bacterium S356]|uniref:DUF3857 domain-containing protein n=1 Tax=Asprobacillus argus TaxID=3076534 RepID=A0ABU3LF95_9FLAO|nr:DUF3857 domain-containing protein [Flavobacteriaceae bacterium S356]